MRESPIHRPSSVPWCWPTLTIVPATRCSTIRSSRRWRQDSQQSPAFNIISDQKIRDTLPLMGRSPREPLNEETARDLCQRIGSEVVLSGSIASVGSHYRHRTQCGQLRNRRFTRPAGGRSRSQGTSAEGAGSGNHEAAAIVGRIAEFDPEIRRSPRSGYDAFAGRPEGLVSSEHRRSEKGDRAAIPFLKRAIELDPNFAMAHANLATLYANLQEPSLSTESMKRAYDLRDRVSERERFYIESHYYHFVTGELEKANQVYEVWAQTYPWSEGHLVNLAVSHGTMGQYEKAVAATLEALRRDPDNYVAYTNLVCHLHKPESSR